MDIIAAALARATNMIEVTFKDGSQKASKKFERVPDKLGHPTEMYTMETGMGLHIFHPESVLYVRLMG